MNAGSRHQHLAWAVRRHRDARLQSEKAIIRPTPMMPS